MADSATAEIGTTHIYSALMKSSAEIFLPRIGRCGGFSPPRLMCEFGPRGLKAAAHVFMTSHDLHAHEYAPGAGAIVARGSVGHQS